MENELKPCPFCGFGIPLLYNRYKGMRKIVCGNCSAEISRSTEEKVIEAWNRRCTDGT